MENGVFRFEQQWQEGEGCKLTIRPHPENCRHGGVDENAPTKLSLSIHLNQDTHHDGRFRFFSFHHGGDVCPTLVDRFVDYMLRKFEYLDEHVGCFARTEMVRVICRMFNEFRRANLEVELKMDVEIDHWTGERGAEDDDDDDDSSEMTPTLETSVERLVARKRLAEGEEMGECSICLDVMEGGEDVAEMPCKHWFHDDCIRCWLTGSDTCPLCRFKIA